jgi:hypothetical protein
MAALADNPIYKANGLSVRLDVPFDHPQAPEDNITAAEWLAIWREKAPTSAVVTFTRPPAKRKRADAARWRP